MGNWDSLENTDGETSHLTPSSLRRTEDSDPVFSSMSKEERHRVNTVHKPRRYTLQTDGTEGLGGTTSLSSLLLSSSNKVGILELTTINELCKTRSSWDDSGQLGVLVLSNDILLTTNFGDSKSQQ